MSTRREASEKQLPSQTEQPKDTAHWMKVFSDVPKAVLAKAVAESIQKLPELQQVILPKLEKALSRKHNLCILSHLFASESEDLKELMKVLDVRSISKKLGDDYYAAFSKDMKRRQDIEKQVCLHILFAIH